MLVWLQLWHISVVAPVAYYCGGNCGILWQLCSCDLLRQLWHITTVDRKSVVASHRGQAGFVQGYELTVKIHAILWTPDNIG